MSATQRWFVEYDNDTGPNDESFSQWWTVCDGVAEFDCKDESHANRLCDHLNATGFEVPV